MVPPYPQKFNHITGVDSDILDCIKVCKSSMVKPREISCLVDCIKLFLVYLILSSDEFFKALVTIPRVWKGKWIHYTTV